MKRRGKAKNNRTNHYSLFKGIVIGLLIGLTLVLMMTFYVNNIFLPDAGSGNREPSMASKDQLEKKPRLSFYDSLLDNRELKLRKGESSPGKNFMATAYYLQVAAFRSRKEAENLKANLALVGFLSRIESSDLEKDDIWYRVRLGPFESETKLWATKTALAQHDYDSNVITEKK